MSNLGKKKVKVYSTARFVMISIRQSSGASTAKKICVRMQLAFTLAAKQLVITNSFLWNQPLQQNFVQSIAIHSVYSTRPAITWLVVDASSLITKVTIVYL